MSTSRSETETTHVRQPTRPYVPAVTPSLRKLLWSVLVLVAVLVANSFYLAVISGLESLTGQSYQNYFYQLMFLVHLGLGLLLVFPFLCFAFFHMRNTWRRKNRRAVRAGYALFVVSLCLIVSGMLLTRMGPFQLKAPATRSVLYWLHVTTPLVIAWLYWLHRLAGPPIKWKWGLWYGGVAGGLCLVMVAMHTTDPRKWNQIGSPSGVKYFEPSLARTASGKFIRAEVLQNDKYCLECHADVHAAWAESAHRFSSFNNPAYLHSVRETRDFSRQRDGNVKRSRWCAGCHDPVPFFSGRFDDPQFDDVHDPTARAGITCTSCHAVTHVNSPRGNADYTIEEPLHYPFARSESSLLQWLNRQMIKAKPEFHKRTFLKPLHKTAEFCGTCHKVHLPQELNDYRFLRGQNHYDSYLLSGVSGVNAKSFYYPAKAEHNCNGCHMPLQVSDDFGARPRESDGRLAVHDHLFLGANTALPHWRNAAATIHRHQQFLQDCVRVDIFGIRSGPDIDARLIAPLRPDIPFLEPGRTYLVETVIRTLTLGHHFTQGTTDSNEVWLEVVAKSGDRVVGRSGAVSEDGEVDRWAHFVNVFMLDRDGQRIDRRNAQDIFVPLYNHQIPPGASQTVHYALQVPADATDSITLEVRLNYRKFDARYVALIAAGQAEGKTRDPIPPFNDLPVVRLADDRVVFPISKRPLNFDQTKPEIPLWQRWNDYGIGMLLKGKAALRQAEQAFTQVESLGRYDGPLNLARVYFTEGRLDEAVDAIGRASAYEDVPWWTLAWISGRVNREQGYLEQAEQNFRSILQPPTQDMVQRGFDFRRDYEIINLLGQTIFDRARQLRGEANRELRHERLREAVQQFQRTLEIDPENVTAHYNLQLIYAALDQQDSSQRHATWHQRYKPDDNARERAVASARQRYPAANRAAEAIVVYELKEPHAASQ